MEPNNQEGTTQMEFNDFREEFNAIQADLRRQYDEDDTEAPLPPLCHILHHELGLDATPLDDETFDERAALIYEQTGAEVERDSLDLTVEHYALHDFLAQIKTAAVVDGVTMDALMATLLITGRRLGMREAARMIGSDGGES